MSRMWKIGLAIVAVIALVGTAVGFVAAQTDSDPAGPFSNFISRLAENLGITEAELNEAIDQTSEDIVDEKEAGGDLTSEQADRIRERIASGEGPSFFGGFGKGFGHGFKGFSHGFGGYGMKMDVAEFIGVTPEELREAVQGSQSIVQVAEANGVSEQELTDYLLGEIEAKLADAVASGRIDQAQADEILANAAEKIAECINREGPPDHSGDFGSFRGGRFQSGSGRFHGAIPLDEGTDVTEAVSPTF